MCKLKPSLPKRSGMKPELKRWNVVGNGPTGLPPSNARSAPEDEHSRERDDE